MTEERVIDKLDFGPHTFVFREPITVDISTYSDQYTDYRVFYDAKIIKDKEPFWTISGGGFSIDRAMENLAEQFNYDWGLYIKAPENILDYGGRRAYRDYLLSIVDHVETKETRDGSGKE